MADNKPILEGTEGFARVCEQLLGAPPAAIGKLGTIELQLAYFRFKTKSQGQPVPIEMLAPLTRNAGLFPPTQDAALKMADELLKSLLHMTTLSPWWSVPQTLELYSVLARPATFVSLQSLECFLSPTSDHWWTKTPAKILVISPFAKTIEGQIPKLDKVWPQGLFHPNTTFQTLAFPLSYGIQGPDEQYAMRSQWTDSLGLLEDMKRRMDSLDYDIVIVGAGIYSLPLVAHAKVKGRKGIHLGGATQLLFGIRGGRWDDMKEFKSFFNEHWVRPVASERPANYQQVEKGCYW
jgi:hypothetical protein